MDIEIFCNSSPALIPFIIIYILTIIGYFHHLLNLPVGIIIYFLNHFFLWITVRKYPFLFLVS